MTMIMSYVIVGGSIAVAAILFGIVARLARADKVESRKSAARARTWKEAVLGQARTKDDFLPDARVRGGMIYNKTEKRLEISGRLSDDSLNRIFRRS